MTYYHNDPDINHYVLELEQNLIKSRHTVSASLEAHTALTTLTIKQLRDRLQQVQADRNAARDQVDSATQAANKAVIKVQQAEEMLKAFREEYLVLEKNLAALRKEHDLVQQQKRDLETAMQALQTGQLTKAGKVDVAALKEGMNRYHDTLKNKQLIDVLQLVQAYFRNRNYQGRELNSVLVEVDRALNKSTPIEDKLTPWAVRAAACLRKNLEAIAEYDISGDADDLVEEAAELLPGFGVNL